MIFQSLVTRLFSHHKGTLNSVGCLLCACMLLTSATASGCEHLEPTRISVFSYHNPYDTSSAAYSVSWELVTAAARLACLQLDPVPMAWNASMKKVRHNEIDLVFGALATDERREWASFSHALAPTYSVLLASKGSQITRWEEVDVDTHVVAATKNSVQWELAGELGFRHRYHVMMSEDNIPGMLSGRIDLYLTNTTTHDQLCLAETEQCLKIIRSDLNPNYLRVMTSRTNKKGQELLTRINAALVSLHKQDPGLPNITPGPAHQKAYSDWLKNFPKD